MNVFVIVNSWMVVMVTSKYTICLLLLLDLVEWIEYTGRMNLNRPIMCPVFQERKKKQLKLPWTKIDVNNWCFLDESLKIFFFQITTSKMWKTMKFFFYFPLQLTMLMMKQLSIHKTSGNFFKKTQFLHNNNYSRTKLWKKTLKKCPCHFGNHFDFWARYFFPYDGFPQ